MSSDIRIKLSDFDAELLANIAEREGRTPEAVVLEALHELFSERLEEKSFLRARQEGGRRRLTPDRRHSGFAPSRRIPAAPATRSPDPSSSEPAADADCLFFVSKQS